MFQHHVRAARLLCKSCFDSRCFATTWLSKYSFHPSAISALWLIQRTWTHPHTHPHSLGLTTRLLIDSPTECTYRICPDTIHAQHTHIHINELNFLLMLHNLQVHQWELQVHLMFPQKLHALCNVLNRVVENEFGDQSECHVVLEFDWDAKGNYPFNLKAKQCPVFFYLWNI